MDPDPKSRQRRRPPSRFCKGQVPLRLWTPHDPARGIRLEQEREHSQQEVTQRNLEQGHRRRSEQWATHTEASSWWCGWTDRNWSYWSWDEYGTSWSEADWRDNKTADEEARPQGSSSSGAEPAALELQRLAAHPVEPIVEEELESTELPGEPESAELPGEPITEEPQTQAEPHATEPAAALVAVECADPAKGGNLLPQQWGPAATALLEIHLPQLQESLHRLAGMDAISHILQMWEAKHYRKLHDVWHTQYESISVGNFALAFTTTLFSAYLGKRISGG